MPEYLYKCEKCSADFSVIKNMKDSSSEEKCPKCKSVKTCRNYAAENGGSSSIFIPKTLGSLMDKNRSKLSKEEVKNMKTKKR